MEPEHDNSTPMPPAAPTPAPVAARTPRIPTPYSRLLFFPRRLVMLCVRPEEWAESARYPLWTTILIALMAVVLSGALFGTGMAYRAYTGARRFAADFDRLSPPMQLTAEGILSVTGEPKEPLRIDADENTVVVDPTGKTPIDSIKATSVTLFNSKDCITRNPMFQSDRVYPIKEIVEAVRPFLLTEPFTMPGAVETINSASINHFLDQNALQLGILLALFVGIVKGIINGLWVLLVMVLAAPLVMIGSALNRKGLAIPPYVARRIALSTTIPLLMFEGVTELLGYSLSKVIPVLFVSPFWLVACGALAFWAGNLARTIFTPPTGRKRAAG